MSQYRPYPPQQFVHPPQGYANADWAMAKKKRTEKIGWAILALILVAATILGLLYITGVLGTGNTNPFPQLWS